MKFLLKVDDKNLYLVRNVKIVRKVNERVLNTMLMSGVSLILALYLAVLLLARKLTEPEYGLRHVLFEPIVFEEDITVELYSDDRYRANRILDHPGLISVDEDPPDEIRIISRLTPEEVELLERLVFLEAGTEDFDGLRLVCDVVLNRVDSQKFPNSVEEVIFQKNIKCYQFAASARSDFFTVSVPDRVKEAVELETTHSRLDSKSLYFGRSPNTKKDLYQHGKHYFSS